MVAARVLNIPVGPWSNIKEVPYLWIERALMAHRAESDAASFHQAQSVQRMFPS